MGSNYEDVKKEKKETIVKFMTSVPMVSAQSKPESPVYVEENTPSSNEEEEEETHQAPSPLHIIMGIKLMQVYITHINIDAKENPFVGYGKNIVCNISNITTYTILDDDEEEEKKKEVERKEKVKRLEEEKKRKEEYVKKRKEEEERKKEIEVFDKMQKTVNRTIANPDLQVMYKKLVNTFDEELTTLVEVALVKAHIKHDAILFDTMCTNLRNDLTQRTEEIH